MADGIVDDISLSSSEVSDLDLPDSRGPSANCNSRLFSETQRATLNAFYQSGMREVGKQYQELLEEASRCANLTLKQVKVSKSI